MRASFINFNVERMKHEDIQPDVKVLMLWLMQL